MVTVPVLAPVTFIQQEPEEKVQVAGDGRMTRPVPDCAKKIVPAFNHPLTRAVHVVVLPT